MKSFIGKKVTLTIGGNPPRKNPDEIVGEEVSIHVDEKDVNKYSRIVGEEVTLVVDSDIDNITRRIMETIKNVDSDKKEEIINYCEKILDEKEGKLKARWVQGLISISADIAQISSLVLQLCTYLPK